MCSLCVTLYVLCIIDFVYVKSVSLSGIVCVCVCVCACVCVCVRVCVEER